MPVKEKWSLWLRWLGANAFGELFGLGLSLVLALFIAEPEGLGWCCSPCCCCGGLEATIVGLATRRCNPGFRRSLGAPGGWAR